MYSKDIVSESNLPIVEDTRHYLHREELTHQGVYTHVAWQKKRNAYIPLYSPIHVDLVPLMNAIKKKKRIVIAQNYVDAVEKIFDFNLEHAVEEAFTLTDLPEKEKAVFKHYTWQDVADIEQSNNALHNLGHNYFASEYEPELHHAKSFPRRFIIKHYSKTITRDFNLRVDHTQNNNLSR